MCWKTRARGTHGPHGTTAAPDVSRGAAQDRRSPARAVGETEVKEIAGSEARCFCGGTQSNGGCAAGAMGEDKGGKETKVSRQGCEETGSEGPSGCCLKDSEQRKASGGLSSRSFLH